MQTGL